MPIVIGKKQLCKTDLKFFKSLQGIERKLLIDRYQSLENIVEANIDAQYQDFLAQPVKNDDIVVWHGKEYNEVPQLLSKLEGDELNRYLQIKEETLNHYRKVINNLKQSGKDIEAKFLIEAIKFVDDNFVYCYDDCVVLGVWGMKLRDNVREPIGEIRIDLFDKTPKLEPKPEPEPIPPIEQEVNYKITFNAGDNGKLNGSTEISKEHNGTLHSNEIPQIEPNDGYEFVGWSEDPNEYNITGDKEFTAQYRVKEIIPPVVLPWYKRFWNWLKGLFIGRRFLRWLIWLLLLILLLLLFSWLFRDCQGPGSHVTGGDSTIGDNDSSWVNDDPRVGDDGGIYDPVNPYEPVPTPPDYDDVLPPEQGVLPPIEGDPVTVPGNPTIIGNRLNILMENDGKSIMDLAKEFKAKYPEEKYKVVYYDNVVKRMQIEFPEEEREQLKKEIPNKFAPEYKLFIFDETLFEGAYVPNDPAFNDNNKTWYLKAIHAEQAWDITRGSEKIIVAIVDNGFNLHHPELNSKVVRPFNVWSHSKEIFSQKVDHGTHVAGTALAIADNGKGICGIAPKCKFMPIQVADKRGLMTTTSVLDGILYALYQGADVINVSLGMSFSGLDQYPEDVQKEMIKTRFKEEERLWREVMRIAVKHNSTLVIAAGNDNVLAGIEAIQRPEHFVIVSAVDKNIRNFNKAQFSNYGSYSTISAPGVGIYSSVGKNSYQIMDGTSMAAPIVTGAIALMKSLNDTLTTKQIICILKATGLKTRGSIGSLIQLDKALQRVKSGDISDCTPIPSSGDIQILLSWGNYNDLDLLCIDPFGDTVYYKNKNVPSGGQLEIDMNVKYPGSKTPIENIYWPKNKAPNGKYKVFLNYFKQHEAGINNTTYNIKIKQDNIRKDYDGVIRKDDGLVLISTFI
jgi:subtilisin family serine protease